MMKLMTKIFITFFLLLLGISKAQNNNLILFDRNKIDMCGHPFTLNDKIEGNPYFKNEIEKFLNKVFVNEDCDSISPVIFKRESFRKTVVEIYTQDYFLEYSIYDDQERWRELYINMIYSCTDEYIYYKLCDDLLDKYIDDGLIAVWDKNAKKLKRLKKYEKACYRDPYRLCELIAVYHNSKMENRKLSLLKQLKKIDEEKFSIMYDFINESEKIDYFNFMEKIFGGM